MATAPLQSKKIIDALRLRVSEIASRVLREDRGFAADHTIIACTPQILSYSKGQNAHEGMSTLWRSPLADGLAVTIIESIACLHYWIKVKPAEADNALLILERHLQNCQKHHLLQRSRT